MPAAAVPTTHARDRQAVTECHMQNKMKVCELQGQRVRGYVHPLRIWVVNPVIACLMLVVGNRCDRLQQLIHPPAHAHTRARVEHQPHSRVKLHGTRLPLRVAGVALLLAHPCRCRCHFLMTAQLLAAAACLACTGQADVAPHAAEQERTSGYLKRLYTHAYVHHDAVSQTHRNTNTHSQTRNTNTHSQTYTHISKHAHTVKHTHTSKHAHIQTHTPKYTNTVSQTQSHTILVAVQDRTASLI